MTQATKRGESALKARNFFTALRYGVLSTISVEANSFPFGSLVPYDLDVQARPIIYISLIAQHYKNLVTDSRASLTVIDPYQHHDPQAAARVTVLARFVLVPDSERAQVQAAYEQRFPGAISYELTHNFCFMRGEIERVRWIGGFGDITWIQAHDFSDAIPDPLAYQSWSAIEHMNNDHGDALRAIVHHVHKVATAASRVTMCSLSSSGFSVLLSGHASPAVYFVPFDSALSSPNDVRDAMVTLARRAKTAGH